ncbi:MAG: hypothetical protein IT320_11610 [Anaerolineae bacterium]|nr:hypothetical protein [Anaerolineae bacterium]
MPYTLFVHLVGDEPFLLEVEELPNPTDTLIIGKHPRRRDNKNVSYILEEVTTVIFPLTRISFLEVMPSGEEEDIFKPFRE